jgi:chromosome segregation protein
VRLDFVEICGFRGFRGKIRIEFGSGFTVISGRNGVGKSTLCDAVEFALRGSIDKYTVEKAAKESLSDYLWWRGEGTPAAHYVTASFKGGNGEQLTVTRTRETGADKTPAEIEAALCFAARPEDAIHQLCKTSIIRDEWIAALSVDLTETERFDLARSALGPVEGVDYGTKAKEVASSAEAAHARDEAAYESSRTPLTNGLTQLSEARDEVARSGDVATVMAIVTAATPDGPSELLARLAAGRAVLATRRARLAGIGEAVNQGREVMALRRAFDAPEATQARVAARQLLARAAAAVKSFGHQLPL